MASDDDELATLQRRAQALSEQWRAEDAALFQEMEEKRRAIDERRRAELLAVLEEARLASGERA